MSMCMVGQVVLQHLAFKEFYRFYQMLVFLTVENIILARLFIWNNKIIIQALL